MNDEMVVRETLGLSPLSAHDRKLIGEMLRYVRREDFRGVLRGAYFLYVAIDLFLKLDQSKGKRRALKKLRDKVGMLIGGMDVCRMPARGQKSPPKNRKRSPRSA
jgi:hypothetical protein